jgi:hypothetical protein
MTEKPVELSTEDKARMRRLQEEIFGRYSEMAMIMERVLNSGGLRSRATQPGAKLTMALNTGRGEQAAEEPEGYHWCIEIDGGAWEDPPGVCCYGGCF